MATADSSLLRWSGPGLALGLVLIAGCGSLTPRPHFEGLDAFIHLMVEEYAFERQSLETLFATAQARPDVIRLMDRPAEAKPWYAYRDLFVTRDRIQGGVKFWREHADVLARAESTYGVPASIIVAILGVETRYGRSQGRHRVLDVLSTLAFQYPRRAAFFRSQLEEFLLLSREESLDPAAVRGSYAGAMGMAQFIPGSYRRLAVDFDGDGRRDLWQDAADAIGSVAHYLRWYGWEPGGPVAIRARVDAADLEYLLGLGIQPRLTLPQLHSRGVEVPVKGLDDSRAALVQLRTREGDAYWACFQNFYVITRYNHSRRYAMAVYDLSRELESRYGAK